METEAGRRGIFLLATSGLQVSLIVKGLYFGAELPETHPLVMSATPMHGADLFPANPPHIREIVLEYVAAMTRLGHTR
jgi:hypothetical protein